jgi:hypothetical protein
MKEKNMNFAKRVSMFVGTGVLAAVCVSLLAPKATHAIVATFVQVANTSANPVPTAPAVPGSPFFGFMQLSGFGSQSVGPGTGTLGVTQIVITSSDTVVDQVNIFSALLSGGTCGGTDNVEAGTQPFLVVKVQPNSTLVIPAPSPLVFGSPAGFDNVSHTCVAAGMPITGGNVIVTINGFVN